MFFFFFAGGAGIGGRFLKFRMADVSFALPFRKNRPRHAFGFSRVSGAVRCPGQAAGLSLRDDYVWPFAFNVKEALM